MNVESLSVSDRNNGVFGFAVLLRINADEHPTRSQVLEALTEAGVEQTAQTVEAAMIGVRAKRPIRADECYPNVMPGEAHA